MKVRDLAEGERYEIDGQPVTLECARDEDVPLLNDDGRVAAPFTSRVRMADGSVQNVNHNRLKGPSRLDVAVANSLVVNQAERATALASLPEGHRPTTVIISAGYACGGDCCWQRTEKVVCECGWTDEVSEFSGTHDNDEDTADEDFDDHSDPVDDSPLLAWSEHIEGACGIKGVTIPEILHDDPY